MSDRTPEQYAIEHGEYLAKAAEGYMNAINEYSAGKCDSDYLSDHWRALQNAVGEFRKRAERCRWNFKYTEMAPPAPPRSEWPKLVRKTDNPSPEVARN
jgi:hypothetical protein